METSLHSLNFFNNEYNFLFQGDLDTLLHNYHEDQLSSLRSHLLQEIENTKYTAKILFIKSFELMLNSFSKFYQLADREATLETDIAKIERQIILRTHKSSSVKKGKHKEEPPSPIKKEKDFGTRYILSTIWNLKHSHKNKLKRYFLTLIAQLKNTDEHIAEIVSILLSYSETIKIIFTSEELRVLHSSKLSSDPIELVLHNIKRPAELLESVHLINSLSKIYSTFNIEPPFEELHHTPYVWGTHNLFTHFITDSFETVLLKYTQERFFSLLRLIQDTEKEMRLDPYLSQKINTSYINLLEKRFQEISIAITAPKSAKQEENNYNIEKQDLILVEENFLLFLRVVEKYMASLDFERLLNAGKKLYYAYINTVIYKANYPVLNVPADVFEKHFRKSSYISILSYISTAISQNEYLNDNREVMEIIIPIISNMLARLFPKHSMYLRLQKSLYKIEESQGDFIYVQQCAPLFFLSL